MRSSRRCFVGGLAQALGSLCVLFGCSGDGAPVDAISATSATPASSTSSTSSTSTAAATPTTSVATKQPAAITGHPTVAIATWNGGGVATLLTDAIVTSGECFTDPYEVEGLVATDGTSVLRHRAESVIQSAPTA